jgi:Flp pilus assembly protein TadB
MTDTLTTERRSGEDRRQGDDRRARGQFAAMFWVVDALVLTLIIFFAIVGGATGSTPLAVVAIACAVLLGVHSVWRLRRRHEEVLSMQDRRARERRGF